MHAPARSRWKALGRWGLDRLALTGLALTGLALAVGFASQRRAMADDGAPQRPNASALIPAAGQRNPKDQPTTFIPGGGGKARTSLFGLPGEGYSFVYVFDRSGSMGGSGRTSLQMVKAELLSSLRNLGETQQFQMIFYNDRPTLFNPSGVAGKLAFGNENNKQRAIQFIDSIVAEGGTDHLEALRAATGMHPDVIFFLTDGDRPKLTDRELEKVQRWAAGTIINTIQFCPGPRRAERSFLEKLAQLTGGQYAFVDSTKIAQVGAVHP
jgi:hypothetical protein